MPSCDELDFWAWPDEQMATVEAMAPRIYAVTTGNGPDGRAPRMWRNAQAGKGRYLAIFLPWHVHPDRDQSWYEVNVEQATEPRLARREFAATPEEAFAAPEGIFFERWDPARNARLLLRPALNWETWRAVDFGFHWPACLWIQVSPKGQPLVISRSPSASRWNGRRRSSSTRSASATRHWAWRSPCAAPSAIPPARA